MRSAVAVAALFFVAAVAVPAREARGGTITLQQGTGGYSGCTDSFLYREDANANYDQSGYLRLYYLEQTG